jgi:putative SOS response-associated peptidase YedK
MVRWGLVPRWAEASASGPINARAETVATNRLFREAFAARRCLVLADGFYEWQKDTKPKQPWRIVMADGAPMAFAGIWERWQPPDGPALDTMAIVTTDANDTVAPIHGRMPVVLDATRAERWLADSTSPGLLKQIMMPCPAEWLAAYTVSRKVNAPAFDDPGCAEPWSEEPAQPRLL